MNGALKSYKWITCAAVAAFFLSFNIAHAVSCNPKAQVHQQRLANIQMAVSFGQIPSADDEQFVLCMLPEKEDQQAFKQRVQQLKNQQRARQLQEEEQRRQAIIAHNQPQSSEELARAQAYCASLVRESGELRNAGVEYCLAAWKANPHSKCAGGNLPCGSEINAPCYSPYGYEIQRCVNGRVIKIPQKQIGVLSKPPWVENAPVQITRLADGVYTDEGIPCGRPGQQGVILIQGTTAQLWGGNTYRLVNTKQAGVLDALNNGTGNHGYNGQIIVSGSTFKWSGYETAPRPFRLCNSAASTVQQSNVQPTSGAGTKSRSGLCVVRGGATNLVTELFPMGGGSEGNRISEEFKTAHCINNPNLKCSCYLGNPGDNTTLVKMRDGILTGGGKSINWKPGESATKKEEKVSLSITPQAEAVSNEQQPEPQANNLDIVVNPPAPQVSEGLGGSTVRELSRDGRFIVYDNGTVLDTKTNLMWAAKDNGSNINWPDAKSYCENYRGGGYTDWRMPKQSELTGLYDARKSRPAACNRNYKVNVATELIDITCLAPWASETRFLDAANFTFMMGKGFWRLKILDDNGRALPVRSAK